MTQPPFPPHLAMTLTHNEHKNYYETVAEFLIRDGQDDRDEWVGDAERAKAIETNELWELQWYPKNPVAFYRLRAASLESLMVAATAYTPSHPDAESSPNRSEPTPKGRKS